MDRNSQTAGAWVAYGVLNIPLKIVSLPARPVCLVLAIVAGSLAATAALAEEETINVAPVCGDADAGRAIEF